MFKYHYSSYPIACHKLLICCSSCKKFTNSCFCSLLMSMCSIDSDVMNVTKIQQTFVLAQLVLDIVVDYLIGTNFLL